jgi:hypothetical protein
VWSPSPVRDGHDPESSRSATGKKGKSNSETDEVQRGIKSHNASWLSHYRGWHDNWFAEGTSDGRKESYRVWIAPSQNVFERITGSSHYAQLMPCTYHVNGPYVSVTRLHKHEYELTKLLVRKHQMACNIQTTMLRRPENSLECLLATEAYSCTRYPFSTFRGTRKGINLHRKTGKNR